MDYAQIANLPDIDLRIATLASRSYDVVGHWQLRLVGVNRWAVQRRVRRGLMREIAPGYFLCGPAAMRPLGEGHRRALAIRHAGPSTSGLARGSAAAQFQVLDRGDGMIHVVSDRHIADIPEHRIAYHRSADLKPDDIVIVSGVPTTTFARTIVDLGHDHTRYQIARAICAGRDQGRLDLHAIEGLLERRRGRAGTREVREAVSLVADGCNGTRGRCEDYLVEGVLQSRVLPVPDVCNRRRFDVGGIEPDLAWTSVGLAVFADGAPHRWVDAAELDRQQMAALQVAGVTSLRFPNKRIWRDRDGVVAEIETAYIACRDRRKVMAERSSSSAERFLLRS